MKTLILIAHPDVMDSSTQQFLIESSSTLNNVTTRFLTDELFDVNYEQQLLKEHDRIIFQFPMYWYSAPYVLKKWLDSVFDDALLKTGLKDKELGLVVSLGVSEESFAVGQNEKFSLSEIFKPFEALANKCQMSFLPIFPISLFSYMEEFDRKTLLINYQQYLTKETNASFKSKESWFIERLHQYVARNSNENLSEILEKVIENRETLDELSMLVNEMRDN